MKRSVVACAGALLTLCYIGSAAAPPAQKPTLVLAIVIDQFGYDYLLRFRGDYTAGLKRILEHGAVFDDAHYIQYPTVTAVGHSTFLTGATPSISGIVGNDWYDPDLKRSVTSVSDDDTQIVGGIPHVKGSSPRKLLVSSLADELKMSGVKSKVIGVSIKDRSAILPAGHMADAAYWFDADSNRWVTSSYYMETIPKWVEAINATRPHMIAFGLDWMPLNAKPGDQPYCSMVAGRENLRYCGSLEATPWGNQLIEDFAERALVEEQMGKHEGTDVLAVSYSSNDYVGHAVGPDAPEIRDISIRTDLLLGRLLDLVDREVGLQNVVIALTADHGVAPVPEVNQQRRMPGGRVSDVGLGNAIQQALETKYGPGKWIAGSVGAMTYFNQDLIRKLKLSQADVQRTAAEAVRQLPHVFRVYTAEELRTGQVASDSVGEAIEYGYYGKRSGDLYVLLDPYYLTDGSGTGHGTAFGYDNHVPVVLMGQGIRAGHYYDRIAVNDVAPTLAAMLGIEAPSGSAGHVLQQIWQ